MERRKDTPVRPERLPREYLDLIQQVFNKNFGIHLLGKGSDKECFVVYGEIYPDEILVGISLKNPENLRMMTAYASMDYPPVSMIPESGSAASTVASADGIQLCVNTCVDIVAGFFQTYFDEGRPVDYDTEYRQDWTKVELDKTTAVYVRLNRDNLELDAASDDFLEQHEAMMEEPVGPLEEAPTAPVEEVKPEEAEPRSQKGKRKASKASSRRTKSVSEEPDEVEEEDPEATSPLTPGETEEAAETSVEGEEEDFEEPPFMEKIRRTSRKPSGEGNIH